MTVFVLAGNWSTFFFKGPRVLPFSWRDNGFPVWLGCSFFLVGGCIVISVFFFPLKGHSHRGTSICPNPAREATLCTVAAKPPRTNNSTPALAPASFFLFNAKMGLLPGTGDPNFRRQRGFR